MKILSASQIRELDRLTILHKPIASIDLMETAANECVKWILQNLSAQKFTILAGRGNNGGDGLAIARLLHNQGKEVEVFWLENSPQVSTDCQINYERLPKEIPLSLINAQNTQLHIPAESICIDAIFGAGLSRPLEGWLADLIAQINTLPNLKIAIDIPSGMYADQIQKTESTIFKANYTLTFHQAKLNVLLPQTGNFAGKIVVLDIGLLKDYEQEMSSNYFMLSEKTIRNGYQERLPRPIFAHKGTLGHSLLVAGSLGKGGASILAARACLLAGTGLLTLLVPPCNYSPLQTAVPEAMLLLSSTKHYICNDKHDFSIFKAIGVGCGIGLHEETQTFLKNLLQNVQIPLVLDADALNIMAQNPDWLSFLPKHSILTPHPKEFERLAGSWQNDYEALEKQVSFAQKYQCFVLFKGAYSRIATPEGKVFFNSTGNPAMATGGMGDVLTGIITALLAQGYPPEQALCIGVYAHGLAGDLAQQKRNAIAITPTMLLEELTSAFAQLASF
jgi:NAD(P)H-hydrate epimerase